jgi:hypothetical protein
MPWFAIAPLWEVESGSGELDPNINRYSLSVCATSRRLMRSETHFVAITAQPPGNNAF